MVTCNIHKSGKPKQNKQSFAWITEGLFRVPCSAFDSPFKVTTEIFFPKAVNSAFLRGCGKEYFWPRKAQGVTCT